MKGLKLTTVGHGLFAGFEPGGNLVIDCFHPAHDGPAGGARVVVQRADIADLIAVAQSQPIAGHPAPSTAPTPDADERAVWLATMNATLSATTGGDYEEIASFAAKLADAALVEYRKRRFGGAK